MAIYLKRNSSAKALIGAANALSRLFSEQLLFAKTSYVIDFVDFFNRPYHTPQMQEITSLLISFLLSIFKERSDLALENLALRQQMAVLKRSQKRLAIQKKDRFFWIWLSRIWKQWRKSLIIVKPDTVIDWHRQEFRLFWTNLSQRKVGGRPGVDSKVKALVRKMAQANPLWGAPRIHGELLKLGIDISERTISRLMPKRRKPPSQTWRTFLLNHFKAMVSIDFFTVPTATFRVLFVFVVLSHERRRIVHFNVTEHPTAFWTAQQLIEAFPEETAQQLIEAFPEETAPRFLLRDRDQIYGEEFRERVAGMKIEEVITAARSPWQNPYVERVIGSIRRECTDHVIVLSEHHLRRILKGYFEYYYSSSQYSFVLCP
jgi:putative transposase